jgi:hypothetical protein
MLRKEIRTHLLAYNLIRSVMQAAAEEYGVEHGPPPRRLSLKGTMPHLVAHRDFVTVRDARQSGRAAGISV